MKCTVIFMLNKDGCLLLFSYCCGFLSSFLCFIELGSFHFGRHNVASDMPVRKNILISNINDTPS